MARCIKRPCIPLKRSHITLLAFLTTLLLASLSIKLLNLPLNRILELRYCQEYYAAHDTSKIPSGGDFIPEKECKLKPIQAKLGWMIGAFETTMQACDLAVALPMGYVADRIGRKLVLMLNLISTAVLLSWIAFASRMESIPPAAILAGPFLSSFGGGNNVFKSVSVSLTSDLAKDETERTSYISYFLSTDYISMLVGPTLAAVIMTQGLWLPLWTGIAFLALALPLVSLLPASQHKVKKENEHTESNVHEQRPLLSDQPESEPEPESTASGSPSPPPKPHNPILNFLSEYSTLLKSSHRFRLLLVAKFLAAFASSSSSLLALYITMRTGWTYSTVGYIYTLKGLINISLTTIIIPTLTTHFTKTATPTSTLRFNILSTNLTLFISILGAIFIALASKPWSIIASVCTYALGSILPIFMYAIARSPSLGVLNEHNEGSGFTLIVVVQAIGSLLGTPTMAAIWVQAVNLDGVGLGLPFFATAGVYALAFVVMGFIKA